jgi:hypothetical protein
MNITSVHYYIFGQLKHVKDWSWRIILPFTKENILFSPHTQQQSYFKRRLRHVWMKKVSTGAFVHLSTLNQENVSPLGPQ